MSDKENLNEIDLTNPFNFKYDSPNDDPFQKALEELIGTPAGRTVIYGIISHCGIYNEVQHGNARDIFDKGKRDVGLWLIATLMEVDATTYPRMLLDVAKRGMLEELRQEQVTKSENDT